jgi:hypothetical protein
MESNSENPIDLDISELVPSGENELPIFDEESPLVEIGDELPVFSAEKMDDEEREKREDEPQFIEEEQERIPVTESSMEQDDLNEEFIIDDYEVLEEGSFEIKEVVDLPEDRIIATDEEQERELREDLLRKLNDKQKTSSNLQKINKVVKRFAGLKYDYSNFQNNEIISIKVKGPEYRPLAEKIKKGDFKDSILNPVLFGKKALHETNKPEIGPIVSDEDIVNSENIIVPEMLQSVSVAIDIREKYKKGTERLRYNLTKETREILDLNNSILYNDGDNGFNISLKDRTQALVNPYEKTKVYSSNLQTREFIDDILFPGIDGIVSYNPFLIQGLLRKEPRQEVFYRYAPLFQVLNHNEPIDFINELPPRVKLDESFEINDNVNVCIPVQDEIVTIPGKIIDINEEHYEIEPLRKKDKEVYSTLKISYKEDKMLITKNTILQKREDNESCLVFEDTIFQFPDKSIDATTFNRFLQQIIPSHRTIFYVNYPILKSIQTLEEIEALLLKFGSSTKQITQESMMIARKFLNYNNELEKVIYKTEYDNFRKKYKEPIPRYEKDKDISLLSKKKLSRFIDFYDEYPDYGKVNDTYLNRLRWLLNRSDKGLLYYKTNALDYVTKQNQEVSYQKTLLESKLENLNTKYENLSESVDKIKESIINKQAGACPEKRLVKRYKTIEDMEFDINRQIFIDNEFLLFHEKKTAALVQEGQYAILETPQGNELWRRENIQGSLMWNKTDEVDGGHLLDSNLDYCNNQGKTLEMLEKMNFNDPKRCVYSKLLQVCINTKDFYTVQEYHTTKEEVISIKNQIQFLDNNENIYEKLNKEIEVLGVEAEQYLSFISKLTVLREKNAKEKEEDPLKDELYGTVYHNIDLYKKSIHKLPIENQYPLYKSLILKMGRPAVEDENPRNIYVKVGKKVLFCKHHEHFIHFYETNSKTAQKTIYDTLVKEYGITVNGLITCVNCGQEIGIAEFETIEGFTESGAYDVTTEALVDNQIEKENSEFVKQQVQYVNLIDSLMMPSSKKGKIDTNSRADVLSVVREYQTLLGVTFKDEEHISIIHQIHSDLDVKKMNEWLKTLPAKIVKTKSRESLETAYNKYNNIESIIGITASFLLLCQTSSPIPVITRAHKSCILSFMGYPLLEKKNNSAINTFVCILKNIRDSNSSIWKSLQKIDIEKKLNEAIDRLLKKPIYKKLLTSKRRELETMKDDTLQIIYAEWNEFRPPLQTRTVKEATINKKNLSKHEKDYLYSLKTIEYIDSVIKNEDTISTLYEPVPLGQSCCHQKLGTNFSVIDYFNKDSSNLVSKSIKEVSTVKLHGENRIHPTYAFPFETRKELLTRFDKNIFAEGDELSNAAIQEFFLRINTDEMSPSFGEPYLFVDGICIRSGKNKQELINYQFTLQDYERVIEKIHKRSLFNIYKNETEETKFTDIIQSIGEANTILGNRPEFKKFLKQLKTNKNRTELFDTLDLKTEVIIETLIDMIPIQNFSDEKRSSMKEFLLTLGKHESVYQESLLTMKEEFAKATQYTKGKFTLYHFIVSFIPSILSLIKPIPRNDFNSYLYEKLRDEEIVFKNFQTKFGSECNFKGKIKKSMKDKDYSNMIFEILNIMKPYENIAYSIQEYTGFESTYIQEIYNVIKLFKSPFEILRGFPVIVNIENKPVDTSRTTAHEIYILSKYITCVFILSLFQGVTTQNDLSDLTSDTIENTSEILNEDGITETDSSIQLLTELDNERVSFFANMFYLLLESYTNHSNQVDYYTFKTMKLELAKDYDRKKNKNLEFYENLDKETAKSLKAMLQVGLESYKRDLADTRYYLLHDINAPILEDEYEQYEDMLDRPVITDEQQRIMDEGDFLPDDE